MTAFFLIFCEQDLIMGLYMYMWTDIVYHTKHCVSVRLRGYETDTGILLTLSGDVLTAIECFSL